MAVDTSTPAPTEDERSAQVSIGTRLLQRPEIGALMGAVLVFAFFTLITDQFGSLAGAARWTDFAATLGIMAVAVSMLMIGGEFDLSAGVMVGSSGLVFGFLITELGLNAWLAIPVVLALAAVVGMANGLLVMRTGLPSFIVTLGTFFVLRGANAGVTLLLTGTVRVDGLPAADGFSSAEMVFASTFGAPYNFRVTVLWWILAAAVATWVLTRTRIGNWIYAVGGDANAARNVGVPVAATKIGLFMTTAMAGALVGIMTALRLGSVQANEGVGREFEFIIAAVVGGCLLTGGFGSAVGASIGALIMGMALAGIPFAGWDSNWRFLFLGVILLLAVLVNNAVRKRAEGARR
ncbi:MAG: ABC transporter permease [Euzebyales bacterium]|jgi:simple sugar transport system permease protein|nr:ABC transporter permease [Euzebyales bacterium]